ncbi:MAG: class I SAM-dependent methyltransferase [Caldilineales bacterium]|nr:class I SAM-dependent methyltransferase [Caldilineales bacterium]
MALAAGIGDNVDMMDFLSAADFPVVRGVIHVSDPQTSAPVTAPYLRVRELEGRLLDDAAARRLPRVAADDSLAKEWIMRADSAGRLRDYFAKQEGPLDVLDLGCGNGWMSHWLAQTPGLQVLGIDVNLSELEQGARVFADVESLRFAYADIFDRALPAASFDRIVMAASLQYFANMRTLVLRLFELLQPQGEIHILDTPFYDEAGIEPARERTAGHYRQMGVPEMTEFYHHHLWSSIQAFNPAILYDPAGPGQRVRRVFLAQLRSPFPWLRLTKV